ncbi:hypothetical protein [Bacillus thuringiensis]|nr:hypothetical protein [Bacillus thuringiensis]OFC81353.1 hypothetical protein BTGOE1_09160 [Bacillus thuringiensis]
MNKTKLLAQLQAHIEDGRAGRLRLVEILYKICEQKEKVKLESNLINTLLSKKRPRIKKVVDDAKKYFKIDIDYLIAKAIMFKTSYIEHNFYSRVLIIKYFLERENVRKELIDILDSKILNTIEYLYFSQVKHKKMLLDLGIYERDINKIIKIIGDDFEDAFELKQRLASNFSKLKDISYVSKYVIKNII